MNKVYPLYEQLVQIAYRHIRSLGLLAFLVVYGILSFLSNRMVFLELGIESGASWRALSNLFGVALMAIGSDYLIRKQKEGGRLKLLIQIFLLGLWVIAIRVGLDSQLIRFNPQIQQLGAINNYAYWAVAFLTTYLIPLLISPLHMVDNYRKRKQIQGQLEHQALEMKSQKLEAEIRFLKAQIHPHFLFNTLNNIYSLIEIDTDQAREVVLKLSAMMQYMLYECKTDSISLQKEIQYIRHFIDLHQLKKDGEMNIQFVVEGNSVPFQIAPLLLVPLFENVFKHGNLENLKAGWMRAKIEVSPERFDLILQNSFSPNPNNQRLPGGIGLENTRARLEMLYPQQYLFEIDKEADQYQIHLQINPKRPKSIPHESQN